MRKRKILDASQGYLLLYHLYRIGIIPKSDLTAYRGIKQDRYLQKVVTKYKKCGYIGSMSFEECQGNKGYFSLCQKEEFKGKRANYRNFPLNLECIDMEILEGYNGCVW